MALRDEILKKIKEEIINDPEGVGYAGKTDDEITVLLNNSLVRKITVDQVFPSPMNRILSGVSDTPNIVVKQDVTDAKNS